jgi:hypothetical protein
MITRFGGRTGVAQAAPTSRRGCGHSNAGAARPTAANTAEVHFDVDPG